MDNSSSFISIDDLRNESTLTLMEYMGMGEEEPVVAQLAFRVHIPLYSLPAFRCIVYHPFRYKVYQCSGGNLTRFSGAKFTDVKKAQVLLT